MQTFLDQTVVVASGQQVSAQFALGQAGYAFLVCPAVTSCSIQIEAAAASGTNFTKIAKADGSSFFVWPVGPGSVSLVISALVLPAPFGRLNLSVAQTAPRSFELVTRR